jgi:hypothetical protein
VENPYKHIFAFENLLLLEVDQVLIVKVNTHICERSPCFLKLFSRESLLAFLSLLAAALQACSPCPLNLDRTNVVHCETMVLEQASCQTHFVSGLDESRTEVLHAPILIFSHDVEWRS